jgi:uncharacterized protein (TIGR02466 family)
METLALFPMPIAHVNIGVHEDIVEHLDSFSPLQDWYDDPSVDMIRENNPTFILTDLPPKLESFRESILTHMNNFAKEVLAYDIKGLQVTQSWVTEQKNEIDFHTHTHPNSIVSAVYYYKDTQEPITPIVFWRESRHISSVRYPTIAVPIRRDIDSPFNWQHYKFQPTPGTLVMFPSWMIHSVDKNTGSSNRRALGINTIPIGGFNHQYLSLDNLEYKDYV